MAWQQKSAEERARDTAIYRDPLYLANRAIVLARAKGRCEKCGRLGRLQVDHRLAVALGGGHDLANLWALCSGRGSCHASKTAADSNHARKTPDPPHTPRTKW